MTQRNKVIFGREEASICQECNKKIKGNNWVRIIKNKKEYLICGECEK